MSSRLKSDEELLRSKNDEIMRRMYQLLKTVPNNRNFEVSLKVKIDNQNKLNSALAISPSCLKPIILEASGTIYQTDPTRINSRSKNRYKENTTNSGLTSSSSSSAKSEITLESNRSCSTISEIQEKSKKIKNVKKNEKKAETSASSNSAQNKRERSMMTLIEASKAVGAQVSASVLAAPNRESYSSKETVYENVHKPKSRKSTNGTNSEKTLSSTFYENANSPMSQKSAKRRNSLKTSSNSSNSLRKSSNNEKTKSSLSTYSDSSFSSPGSVLPFYEEGWTLISSKPCQSSDNLKVNLEDFL